MHQRFTSQVPPLILISWNIYLHIHTLASTFTVTICVRNFKIHLLYHPCSMFATMIEGLLARFEFDAEDTRITLVHPGHASITVTLADLRYRTEESAPEDAGSKTRSVTLSGLNVTATDEAPSHDLSSSATSTRPPAARLPPTRRRLQRLRGTALPRQPRVRGWSPVTSSLATVNTPRLRRFIVRR